MNNRIPATLRTALKYILLLVSIPLGLYLIYKLSFYLAPFIVAIVVASLMEPLIRLLTRKLKMNRSLASAVAMISVILVFGSLIALGIIKLVTEVKELSGILPQYVTDLYNDVHKVIVRGTDFYHWLPKEVTDNMGSLVSDLSKSLAGFLNPIVQGAFSTAVSVPEAFIFVLVTIISTYFFASDREKIYNFFKSQLPDSWSAQISSIKNEMFAALIGYVKAQLIMMSITFVELFIGFSLIHVKYSLVIALAISIIDALPVLGSGGVLIPWAVYSFITGDSRMGISILVIYGVILVVRQMIEPKILGNQIGVHPLLTLVAMYVGLKAFGVAGLILGPVTFLLLKNIFTGVLKDKSLKDFFGKISASLQQGHNVDKD